MRAGLTAFQHSLRTRPGYGEGGVFINRNGVTWHGVKTGP